MVSKWPENRKKADKKAQKVAKEGHVLLLVSNWEFFARY
jgi:translation elongation factor EF-Ts